MNISITILNNDYDVEYDFKITSPGSGGCAPSLSHPGDPPEPPEFEIEVLSIARSAKPEEELELPKWLKELLEEDLAERDTVQQAVYEAAAESGESGDYDE